MRNLTDAVVVITGASSGIGRATALAFAGCGAKVVLAARREERLQAVAQECEDLKAEALVIPCDVTNPAEVQDLADRVVSRFGRINVWVNNAGVTAFGRTDEMPYDVYRRVLETNLLGSVHGARAALAQFRRQGRGVLINVSSMAGKIGHPYMSAYSASKYGVVGLSDSIRAELPADSDIHVCTVLPVATDTPLFQHGANYLGQEARPPRPVYSAERVAECIVSLARRPRREVAIGAAGKLLKILHQLAPGLTGRALAWYIAREHFKPKAVPPDGGNVRRPTADPYGVTGGWKHTEWAKPTSGTPAVVGLGLAALGAGAAYALFRMAASRRDKTVDVPREELEDRREEIATEAGDGRQKSEVRSQETGDSSRE